MSTRLVAGGSYSSSLVLVSSRAVVRYSAITAHGESMRATFGAKEARIEVILKSTKIETEAAPALREDCFGCSPFASWDAGTTHKNRPIETKMCGQCDNKSKQHTAPTHSTLSIQDSIIGWVFVKISKIVFVVQHSHVYKSWLSGPHQSCFSSVKTPS